MPTRILEAVPATNMAPPATAGASLEERQIVLAAPTQTAMVRAPTLKLSFGGVDFSLLPQQNSDGTVTFQTMGPNEAVLSLKNFTGDLCVICTSPTIAPAKAPVRQDSVTPSPQHGSLRTTSPPTVDSQLLPNSEAVASPKSAEMTRTDPFLSSQAPTPTTANGHQTHKNHLNSQRRVQVKKIMVANRHSPLPYCSPVKRSRMRSNRSTATKKSKVTPLSQHFKLSPSPIATRKAQSPPPNTQLSEPDCSQTQPSNSQVSGSSQVSMELEDDHGTENGVKMEKIREEDNENVIDNEMETADSEGPAEEDSKNHGGEEGVVVSTQKAEDEDEDSVATLDAEEENAEETAVETSLLIRQPESTPLAITPAGRWGHCMNMVDHNRILVYGGQAFEESNDGDVLPNTLSDVHVFDMEQQKWFQPIQCDDKTRQHPRQWATSTYIPNRQLLVVFGGEHLSPKTGKFVTSDKSTLMVLDTEILLWYPPQVSGDLPSGRSGHTATLLPSSADNELVIFGGVKAGKHLNSVNMLNTKAWRWSSLKIQGSAPKPRSYHTATAIKATQSGSIAGVGGHHSDHISNSANATINVHQRIVIFGGNDHNESFNTVHVLEKTEGATSTWRWFHPEVSGTRPKPRTGHSATLLSDQKTILFYGGWDPMDEEGEDNENDDSTTIFQDSFLLDTDTWTFREGPAPVFAGHSLDASQGANGGGRRVGHCAVLNTNNKGADEVLVFGGRVPGDDFTGDFQTLTISL